MQRVQRARAVKDCSGIPLKTSSQEEHARLSTKLKEFSTQPGLLFLTACFQQGSDKEKETDKPEEQEDKETEKQVEQEAKETERPVEPGAKVSDGWGRLCGRVRLCSLGGLKGLPFQKTKNHQKVMVCQ